jgi:hypothetical protein
MRNMRAEDRTALASRALFDLDRVSSAIRHVLRIG